MAELDTLQSLPLYSGNKELALIHLDDGRYCFPALLEKPLTMRDRLHERGRCTGESGSGPYFSAYYTPPSGVLSYWETGPGENVISDNIDLDTYGDPHYPNTHRIIKCDGIQAYCCTTRIPKLWFQNSNYEFVYAKPLWWLHPKGDDKRLGFWGIYVTKSRLVGSYEQADEFFRQDLALAKSAEPGYCHPRIAYQKAGYEVSNQPSSIPYELGENVAWEAYSAFDEIFDYQRRFLQDQAYINAAENLPAAATNSIANVLEWASLINDLRKGEMSGIGSIRDAWLGWRYSYNTTKQDIEEYAAFTARLANLASMPVATVFGSCERWGITCIAQFEIDVGEFIPKDAREWLKSYGFEFSLVNAWDMVPYSFVVDWFAHVGDFLQGLQNADTMYHLHPKNFWNVFLTNYKGVKTYTRVPGEWRYAIPWVTFGGTSNKTIGKRVLDSIALFT